jgi:hypothetical protein
LESKTQNPSRAVSSKEREPGASDNKENLNDNLSDDNRVDKLVLGSDAQENFANIRVKPFKIRIKSLLSRIQFSSIPMI